MGTEPTNHEAKKQMPEQSHARGSRLESFRRNGGLRPAEEKLHSAVQRGRNCILGDGARPVTGTPENTIRASFLRYLILGGCEKTPIHQRGIHLFGAFIAVRDSPEFGKCLDLQAVTICQNIAVCNSIIDGSVILLGAESKSLYFNGSSLLGLKADGLTLNGSLFLRNDFQAAGEVRLPGAKIGGDLDCSNGQFNAQGKALSCDKIDVKGSIFLCNGFQATDKVRLVGAKIGGDLDCSNGQFNAQGKALSCDKIDVKGSIFLCDGFQAAGEVRLLGAKIGGDLDCSNGIFSDNLYANNAAIGGNLFLVKDFQIKKTVVLPNATIDGNIFCDTGVFHNKDQTIHANKAIIGGNVILGSANSAGSISFHGAIIEGDFSANGATLSGKPCLQLRGANIKGTFHWREVAHAVGRLDLGGAETKTINMDLESWGKPKDIKLNNFTYLGFENMEAGANSNYWKRFLERQPFDDLNKKFRPRPYEHLANILQSMGYEEEARSIRIERQHRTTRFMANYDPDRMTTGADGKKHKKWTYMLGILYRRFISGPLIDYGFRPVKAMLFLLGLIVIGTGIYDFAAHRGIMTPTHPLIFKEAAGGFIPSKCAENWVYFPDDVKEECENNIPSEYSEFQAFIYAADIVLPIVNLRMENDWAPRVVDTSGKRDRLGYWVRIFEWFSIVAGWLLSLLFVSAVGGIIRR